MKTFGNVVLGTASTFRRSSPAFFSGSRSGRVFVNPRGNNERYWCLKKKHKDKNEQNNAPKAAKRKLTLLRRTEEEDGLLLGY